MSSDLLKTLLEVCLRYIDLFKQCYNFKDAFPFLIPLLQVNFLPLLDMLPVRHLWLNEASDSKEAYVYRPNGIL